MSEPVISGTWSVVKQNVAGADADRGFEDPDCLRSMTSTAWVWASCDGRLCSDVVEFGSMRDKDDG